MTLWLNRVQYFTDFMRDTLDDRIIGPGEYYYRDDETGDIISAEHYWELKKAYMEDNWDESYYNAMESERDYKEKLRQAEQQYKERTILQRIRNEDIRKLSSNESIELK